MHVKTCSRPSIPVINFDAPWDQRWCPASTLIPRHINVDAGSRRINVRWCPASTLMPDQGATTPDQRASTYVDAWHQRWCQIKAHQRWCPASTLMCGINVDAPWDQRWCRIKAHQRTLMPGINVRWCPASTLMPDQGASTLMCLGINVDARNQHWCPA